MHTGEKTDDDEIHRWKRKSRARTVEKGLCGVGGTVRDEDEEEEGDKHGDGEGGRSREMIPLSNPLDTRLVWLPTGSERERGGGRQRERRQTQKETK